MKDFFSVINLDLLDEVIDGFYGFIKNRDFRDSDLELEFYKTLVDLQQKRQYLEFLLDNLKSKEK